MQTLSAAWWRDVCHHLADHVYDLVFDSHPSHPMPENPVPGRVTRRLCSVHDYTQAGRGHAAASLSHLTLRKGVARSALFDGCS